MPAPPTADDLRAAFDAPAGGHPSVGLEEELMLLDAETLDLAPRAAEALAAVGDDPRFKLEMPAAQFEIVTAPHATVGDAARELADARRALARAVAGRMRVAGAGAHPFASGRGPLNAGPRYDDIGAEYAGVALRQLVFGLHVHVAIQGADRALAVYNALRSYLPHLAALAANAPFYEGRDSGLASVRSRIAGLLPRQGVPPPFASWDAYAEALRWGRFDDPRQWWWELRLHPTFGTVEVRVPDTQATVADTAAVAAVAHALATRLAARHDGGAELPVAESWRIDENRWAACRHGVEGTLADLATGERRPTRERLDALLDDLALARGAVAARQRDAELGAQRRHQLARRAPLAGAQVGELALEPVAAGRPAVVVDPPRLRDGQPLAGVVALGEPRHQRVDDGGDRRGVVDRALGVRHAHLDRAERRMQAQLPPPLAGVVEAAPAQRPLVGVEALERGRDALAREQAGDPRTHRRQAAVAALVERRVGGERRQLGQMRAQRVVDRERPLRAADGDMDVQAEDELTAGDGGVLGADRLVARAGVERADARRERVRAGAGQP